MVSFDKSEQEKVLVKIDNKYMMKFKDVFQITHEDESVAMMYDKHWKINEAKDSDAFVNDYYSSMDCINVNQYKYGWNLMTNITEPVYLIYNCVPFE